MIISCGTPPGNTWVTFDVSAVGGPIRPGGAGTTGVDVTGCALSGPAGNEDQMVFDILKTY